MSKEIFTTKARRHEEGFLPRSAEIEIFVSFVSSWFKPFFLSELA
jgi:hypothetical protein